MGYFRYLFVKIYSCSSLTSITIPNSVTGIGDYAFFGCTNLTTIYYIGTKSEWNTITVNSEDNDCFINATPYFYSENPVTAGNYWHYVGDVPTIWESVTTES